MNDQTFTPYAILAVSLILLWMLWKAVIWAALEWVKIDFLKKLTLYDYTEFISSWDDYDWNTALFGPADYSKAILVDEKWELPTKGESDGRENNNGK